MSIYRELSYDQDIDIIKGLQFSVSSPEEIRRRAVVNVIKTDTYTSNKPVQDGLFDPRMGVLEHGKTCATCGQTNVFCPGHFGKIELARPVFHPMFFDMTRKVLKCVCYRCSTLLISEDVIEDPTVADTIRRAQKQANMKKRWDAMFKLADKVKGRKCPKCEAIQPKKYDRDNSMRINAELIKMDWGENINEPAPGAGPSTIEKKEIESSRKIGYMETEVREMPPEEVLRIFQHITRDDMEKLGFNPEWNQPEWMIMTVMPVPPPAVRPSIIEESGQRREDDITHKLSDIVKYNNILKSKMEGGTDAADGSSTIKSISMLLQYHIATLMNNGMPGMPAAQQRNGRKLKSIVDRLKKKEGRIRGNLNGKRVDQSARSVITPDPYMGVDEVGVPIRIAMSITFPEVVNAGNREEMQRLIVNGPDNWPGAKYVRIASTGMTKTLKYANTSKIAAELKDGDIVDRHMRDGDYILFNRQPSLHKMSMMGHRVRVMPYQTLRLSVLATAPYNADFDGDEMNIFMPQSVQSMGELIDIAAVPYMILAPRDGKPVIEVVQDSMVGSYRLTKHDTRIHDITFANLQMVNSYFNGRIPRPLEEESLTYSGRQAFSAMLPPGLFIDIKSDKSTRPVKITNSLYQEGDQYSQIEKNAFHARSKGFIPVIYHDYGAYEAIRFLDNTQRLICRWLMSAGFSMGISDLVVNQETQEFIQTIISEQKEKARQKNRQAIRGELSNTSIQNNQTFFENEIRNILNETDKLVSSKVKEYVNREGAPDNRMLNMILSGAKGKDVNVTQMIGCLAQQNIDGKRVAYGFTDRTLPHFTKFDDGPEARGFVENSFIRGLAPHEVFFHAMAGREGLIDTAVRSVTGDTRIVVMVNGKIKQVEIGPWIDEYMEKYKDDIQNYSAHNQELLTLNESLEEIYIPNIDANGKLNWGELTAVTRHDPGPTLFKVETISGRHIIVTESHSLLVWDYNKKEFHKKLTKDVKIGDYIPVTGILMNPPHIIEYVDMSEYFPKEEYVYGTEYYKAKELMEKDMVGRERIPAGWWEKNNNINFTVPYVNTGTFRRALKRSETENIHKDCFYPFDANRTGCRLPDKFILNYENGIFIGIFLADGCANIDGGTVLISKEEKSVQNFVIDWFNKYNIKNSIIEQKRKIGTSYGVRGNSRLLAQFLTYFVGHGAYNKYIPDVALNGPIEFVKGLLNGYFSGDGSMANGQIEAQSASFKLIDGITMLLNRLGIFSKIHIVPPDSRFENSVYRKNVSIRSKWGAIFAKEIKNMISKSKDDKLRTINFTENHINYPDHNDVILDSIKNITRINPDKYPKVYDVTVPGTLNFSLANGIHCHDTSDTGYIQRRLIKAMEDTKIYYDQTVRNATGSIVQFLYGEDGMNGTRIENQYIPTIEMALPQLDLEYYLRPSDAMPGSPLEAALTDEALKQKFPTERLREHFEQILADREYLIEYIFDGEKDSKISYPIPFERIFLRASEPGKIPEIGFHGIETDLTPEYILDKIESLKSELRIRRTICDADFAFECDQGTRFLHILLNIHLSPKPVLLRRRLTREMFDWVCSEITRYFWSAVAVPGEMVGVVAGQTIGENTTQLVLDSFHASGTVAAVKATSGVPRFKELLSVSRHIKTPILTIYLKPDISMFFEESHKTTARNNALDVLRSIEVTRLSDILEKSEIYWDPMDAHESDRGILDVYKLFSEEDQSGAAASPWVLRMTLNRVKMNAVRMTMLDIYVKIQTFMPDKIECIFSDDNAPELILRIRLRENLGTDTVAELKAIEYNLMYNPDMLLKGTRGIKKVSMHLKTSVKAIKDSEVGAQESAPRYDTADLQFRNVSEWVLDTDGTNLLEMLANPNIDETRTHSNDIWEIYRTLGIEAARQALYNEMMDVSDNKLTYRHLSLLLDTMTCRGQLMSIDRHGINTVDIGPLAKCSFEETTEMLIEASIFGQYDNINGVSANIMLGQLAPCGTGVCDVILDETEYAKLTVDKIRSMAELPPRVASEPSEPPPAAPLSMGMDKFYIPFPHVEPIVRERAAPTFEITE